MICKNCGSRLSGSVCPSCKKVAALSYTSHELADLLRDGIINHSGPNEQQFCSVHTGETENQLDAVEEQLRSAYNSGFSAGQKRGFAKGFDSAQKESAHAIQKRQRFFVILAASCAIVLALFSSIVTGAIRYNSGYRNGIIVGKQEQQQADDSLILDSYQQGYANGRDEGYQAGYEQGLLVTPVPSPAQTSTPEPFMLRMKSKGDDVRQLQQRFIDLGYLAENEADGDFGSKTEEAVKQFQVNHELEPTGIVDQDLWEFIMSDKAIAATPPVEFEPPTPTIDACEATNYESGADEVSEENAQPYEWFEQAVGIIHLTLQEVNSLQRILTSLIT